MMRRGFMACAFVLAGCAANAARPPAPPPVATVVVPLVPEKRVATGITTPLPGEPDAAALAASRLVPETCADAVDELALKAKIAEMRAAVDESFKEWKTDRAECGKWHGRPAYRSADAVGDAFGAGGLGLSGVGQGGGGRGEGVGLGAEARAPAPKTPAGKAGHSSTNNQVASVDEADIVKTDGKFVYLAANGALRIFDAASPRELSVTRLGKGENVRELFVEGDRAVVYASIGTNAPPCTYGYDCAVAGDGSATKIVVYDIAQRDRPQKLRTIDLSGSLIAARRVGNVVHTVVADGDAGQEYESWPDDLDMCAAEGVGRARFAKLKAENERKLRASAGHLPTLAENGKKPAPMCQGLYRTAFRDGKAFTSVVSFDLASDAAPTTSSVQSRPGTVFASETGLYIAVRHESNGGRYAYYGSADEVSDIHRFAIGADAGATRYAGSGTIPGHVLNQFAMDEWNGYLRVATTKGHVPDPAVESEISILAKADGGALTRVGKIAGLAPGEDIRSVRFDDERAYVVTFKKTDPLFVIDTFEPQAPKVLGELKIPGFSTYLHRIDPTHLMSIGFDANDHGDFAYFDGIILQMFDVTHPTEPRLLHKEKIGTRGSSSEAATNHLAFNWLPGEKILALPMTICEGGGDGRNGHGLAFSGLLVYDVDLERGFTRRGGVDHGKRGADCGTWWSSANSAVKRSVFVDDLVWSIATDRMKVQRKTKLGTDVADLSLTR